MDEEARKHPKPPGSGGETGMGFLFTLALLLLFSLLRSQRRNRKLLEEKIADLEDTLDELLEDE